MEAFDYDMISRYLDGDMNTEERAAFKGMMLQDSELQKEVELVKEVNATLQMKLYPDEHQQALVNTLEEMRGAYFKPRAKIVPFKRLRWMMAAAVVFVGLIVISIWQPWQQKDLYQQYASIQMPGVAERGTPTDSLLKKATDNFNDKKFAAAIPLFESLLKTDPQNSFVQYYYAIALLQNDQTEKARTELIQLYNGTSLFRYDAAFYMALSYLKEKDNATCKEWLNKIPADASLYNKAQELLKKL